MALDGLELRSLTFDLPARQVAVVHAGPVGAVLSRLEPLGLGARLARSEPAGDEPARDARYVSTFAISKMDCPSEESLIRLTLDGVADVASLSFDLPGRRVTVIHRSSAQGVLERLAPLNLGATLVESKRLAASPSAAAADAGDAAERRMLRQVLGINAAMFVIELALGVVAQSAALVADSLDMFADAAVYGLALYSVGRAATLKARAAHLAGWLQLALALGALAEVARRFALGSEPQSLLMWGVGLVALAANVTCLVLVSRQRDRGAHLRASFIFSANDVIANLGVIAAGALVALTGSPYPDLVIGLIIGLVVLSGARRILRLR